jgi:hypothetical protein
MKAPNFFIIGAPKCGTTALSEYLRNHPQAFMCHPKEPHYFAEDFPEYRAATTLESYLDLFAAAPADSLAAGEASVFYLYSDCAVANILRVFPEAKFIVMLRNPFELAISMHAQAVYSGDDLVRDFSSAWAARKARYNGITPFTCRDTKPLTYDRVALIGQQLQRALSIVPQGQLRWWFYDDFSADSRKVYLEVLGFLGLADDKKDDFPKINARSSPRSSALTWATQRTPKPLIDAALGAKRILGIKRLGMLNAVRRMNTKPAQAPNVSPSVQAEMRDVFKPDIQLLSQITGRDLSHWLA